MSYGTANWRGPLGAIWVPSALVPGGDSYHSQATLSNVDGAQMGYAPGERGGRRLGQLEEAPVPAPVSAAVPPVGASGMGYLTLAEHGASCPAGRTVIRDANGDEVCVLGGRATAFLAEAKARGIA